MIPSLRTCLLEMPRTEDLPPMGKVYLVVVPHGEDKDEVVAVLNSPEEAWQEADRFDTASVVPVSQDHPFLRRIDPRVARRPTPPPRSPSLTKAMRGGPKRFVDWI